MKEYLKAYIDEIDLMLKEDKITENIINKHLIKIKFFQHERLIHLLVTLFYALFTVLFIFLTFKIPLFSIIVIILLVFLCFYVKHYFFLENGVQYLYKQYDLMVEKIVKENV